MHLKSHLGCDSNTASHALLSARSYAIADGSARESECGSGICMHTQKLRLLNMNSTPCGHAQHAVSWEKCDRCRIGEPGLREKQGWVFQSLAWTCEKDLPGLEGAFGLMLCHGRLRNHGLQFPGESVPALGLPPQS